MISKIKSLPLLVIKGMDNIRFTSTIASISGWIKHANNHNLRISIMLDKLKDCYSMFEISRQFKLLKEVA